MSHCSGSNGTLYREQKFTMRSRCVHLLGQAPEWIEYAHGAFGHFIGKHAAPCDLHRAAMQLYHEAQPEDEVVVEWIDGEVLEYDSKVPKGSLT